MTNRFFAGQTNFIEELNALDGESGDAQQAIDDHIADTTGAHAASAISNTPAGNIAATTVQAAINELDAAKANLAGAAFTGAVSATSFTGPLSGNASTATTLATARNINGVSFNGSADITVTAAAGTLTGATLAAGVTASSLTSVGTLTALTVSGQASFAAGSAAAPSVKVGGEQNGLYSSAANTLDVTLNGVRQAQFSYTASAVNYFSVTGNTTLAAPILLATGSDSSVSAIYSLKGGGAHVFYTGTTSLVQFAIGHVASAVNYAQITGAATGNAVTISTAGSDANRSIAITPAGTGGVVVGTTTLTAGAVFEVRVSADGTNFIVGGSGTTNLLKVAAGSADAMALYVNNTTEVLRLETAGGARLAAATAIPAGGTAGLGYMVSSSTNFGVFFGSGAPTLSAAKGSLYLRSDGTGTSDRAYINADGGTTWTALTTAA